MCAWQLPRPKLRTSGTSTKPSKQTLRMSQFVGLFLRIRPCPQSVREGEAFLTEPYLCALCRVQTAQRRRICAEARRSAGRAAFAEAQSPSLPSLVRRHESRSAGGRG
jgi:hypothetical protein